MSDLVRRIVDDGWTLAPAAISHDDDSRLLIVVAEQGQEYYKTVRLEGELSFLRHTPLLRHLLVDCEVNCWDLSSLVVSEWTRVEEQTFLNREDVDLLLDGLRGHQQLHQVPDRNKKKIFHFLAGHLTDLVLPPGNYQYQEQLMRFDWKLNDLIFFRSKLACVQQPFGRDCYPLEVITMEISGHRFVHSILSEGIPLYRFNQSLSYDEDVLQARMSLTHTREELFTYHKLRVETNCYHKKSLFFPSITELGENFYHDSARGARKGKADPKLLVSEEWVFDPMGGREIVWFLGWDGSKIHGHHMWTRYCLAEGNPDIHCCHSSKPLAERLAIKAKYGRCFCYLWPVSNPRVKAMADFGDHDPRYVAYNISQRLLSRCHSSNPGYVNPLTPQQWEQLRDKAIVLIKELYQDAELPAITLGPDESPYHLETHFGRLRL